MRNAPSGAAEVDERPKRLDAYVRVSTTRGRTGSEKFTSPTDQETAIRRWAELYGHEITDDGPDNGAWHELDVSGGTMDRPKLNEVLARIDAGESDGIVVYRLDRFGRTLIGALTIIERLYEQGKLFASVYDQFDISNENGRLVLRIMLSLAQYERERIQSQWRRSRNNAVERGWHISAYRPFGYQRERLAKPDGELYAGRLVPDPTEAPLVAELFRRRAAGEPWTRLVRWLNATGVPTSRDKATWSTRGLMQMVANRVYLGVASGGVGVGAVPNPHAHEPIVDAVTWQAAQGVPRTRRFSKGTGHDAIAMGIARCASCRYVMGVRQRAGSQGSDHDYFCARAQNNADCPDPAAIVAYRVSGAPTLDAVITEAVLERLESRAAFEALDAGTVDLAALESDWLDAVARRDDAAEDVSLEDEIGSAAWRKRVAALNAFSEEKLELLRTGRREAGRARTLERPVRELCDDWRAGRLSTDQKRDLVASAVQAVFVRPGHTRSGGRAGPDRQARQKAALRRRVHIVWSDEPAVDVPRQGRRDWRPKPFEFPLEAVS